MTENTNETVPATKAGPVTADQRKYQLGMAIAREVSSNGWRVESQSDYQAVLAKGKPTNHVLHFFIGLFTLGVWWCVWPVVWLLNRRQTKIITVDEYGNTLLG